jgi:toxin ParE1/3/4
VIFKVRFTPAARAQLLAALTYIHADRPSAAEALRQHAEEALSRLHEFPESGRVLPEFPDLLFREVIVAPYRFFYRVKADTVWIVAVWHAAQLSEEPGDERHWSEELDEG